LETYLKSVNTGHVDVSKLQDVVHHYDATAEELDDRVTKLEEELKELKTAAKAEQEKLAGPTGNEKLNLRATIGVFADGEGEVKIALIYGTCIHSFIHNKHV
jgi:chromosome segregation ATPase